MGNAAVSSLDRSHKVFIVLQPLAQPPDIAKTRRLWLVLAAFGLVCVFFVTEHNLQISLQESYTQTREEMEASTAGGNAPRRAAFLALAALGACLLLRERRRSLPLNSVLSWCMLAFVAWCAASVLWSVAPQITVRRVIVLVCCFIGALGVGRAFSARELCVLAVMITSAFLAAGVAAEVALGTFHPLSGEYRFSGTVHPNSQGLNLATLCLGCLCLAGDSRSNRGWPRLLLFGLLAIALCFLVLTKSRTSVAAVGGVLAIVWFMKATVSQRMYGAFAAAWLGAVAAFALLLSINTAGKDLSRMALLGRQEQSSSLSGRVPIWTEVSGYILERPIMGHGYESFWTPETIDAISSRLYWGIREAHNSYLETVLGVGLVGLLIALMCVAAGAATAWRELRRAKDPAFGSPLAWSMA